MPRASTVPVAPTGSVASMRVSDDAADADVDRRRPAIRCRMRRTSSRRVASQLHWTSETPSGGAPRPWRRRRRHGPAFPTVSVYRTRSPALTSVTPSPMVADRSPWPVVLTQDPRVVGVGVRDRDIRPVIAVEITEHERPWIQAGPVGDSLAQKCRRPDRAAPTRYSRLRSRSRDRVRRRHRDRRLAIASGVVPTGSNPALTKPPAPSPRRTLTLLAVELATARSATKSPLKSPATIAAGFVCEGTTMLEEKPPAPFPSSTVTVATSPLVTAMSAEPSPLKSAGRDGVRGGACRPVHCGCKAPRSVAEENRHRAAAGVSSDDVRTAIAVEVHRDERDRCGRPCAKFRAAAKVNPPVLRSSDTLFVLLFVTTMSRAPSPSKSADAAAHGLRPTAEGRRPGSRRRCQRRQHGNRVARSSPAGPGRDRPSASKSPAVMPRGTVADRQRCGGGVDVPCHRPAAARS